jgi:hypothetical protein
MSLFCSRISHLLGQIISDLASVTINDKCRIKVLCGCGKVVEIGARSFMRRWEDSNKYLCKSCHVKTYIDNPDRLKRFKKTFAKTASTPEHRKRCSEGAKKLWRDPAKRAAISHAVGEDNKTNPKKAAGRAKALKAFMAKSDYKAHLARIRGGQLGKISLPERIIKGLLIEIEADFQPQFVLGPYRYDFKVEPSYLIEVQGEYWHRDSVAKDSAKATYASRAGYKVIHVWEHEFNKIGKIKHLLLERLGLKFPEIKTFSFADTILSRVETLEARCFLGKYHYLPAISKYGKHYGAFVDDTLVAVCTFSGVTRKETANRLGVKPRSMRELSRFCIHPSYQKKNFASYLLSRFVKLFGKDNRDVKMLVSFADHTEGHEGTIYKATNWTYDGDCKASYYYISADGCVIHKKTVWDRAKKLGMSEADYASSHRYAKRRQATKSRFILRIN